MGSEDQTPDPIQARSQPGSPGSSTTSRRWSLYALTLSIVLSLLLRSWLLARGDVPFNSDEAIVGLMARHITQGARPVFFYGQSYMGSLDAWLIAGVFQILGEGLLGIRVVQVALYLVFLGSAWLVARRFFDLEVAAWAVLLAALPPVLVLTYTSATLGGYGETLVLGNLILLLGHRTLSPNTPSHYLDYLGLGLVGGVAFWTLGIAAVYLAPLAILHVTSFNRSKISFYLLATLGFMLASSPWWLSVFTRAGDPLEALVSGYPASSTVWQRTLGLLVLGIPALLGLRFPWSPTYVALPLVFLGTVLNAAIAVHLFEQWRSSKGRWELGTRILLLMVATFLAAFLGTQFGLDSTGRYLLPLFMPFVLAAGRLIQSAWRWHKAGAMLLLSGFLILNLAGLVSAIRAGDGLTTQFGPITRFGNEHDAELVQFLHERDYASGYSNYWVAYRIAFITGESIKLAPSLPYQEDLSYTPLYDRIDGYREAADLAEDIVYVTSLHPRLDALLREGFSQQGVTFDEAQIGPYHVFHGFDEPVRPDHFRFGDASP